MSKDFGHIYGQICWRNGCQGIIDESPVDNCSCHLFPPCSACMKDRGFCVVCDWCAADDTDYVAVPTEYTGLYIRETFKETPLDPRKVDYRLRGHSSSSMLCEGVYPLHLSLAEVESVVRGTFGGRFESFGDGKFKYIAYTD